MTELDQTIASAYSSQGKKDDVNKVYLTLLRTMLFLPVKKAESEVTNPEEPFQPLFAKIDDNYFILAFDTLERLTNWAGDQLAQIDYVELTGKEIIAGINESVFFCLNLGTDYYKEFSPDEVLQLKKVVARIDQLKQ